MKRSTAPVVLALGGLSTCKDTTGEKPAEDKAVTSQEGVPMIHDGRTIRLVGIDACEPGQPARLAGAEIDCELWAKDSFREMIGPRSVRCENSERDVYDRPLAVCFVGDRNLNRALVQNGYAFPHARDSDYRTEADEMRGARRGSWLIEDLSEPGEYRPLERDERMGRAQDVAEKSAGIRLAP